MEYQISSLFFILVSPGLTYMERNRDEGETMKRTVNESVNNVKK